MDAEARSHVDALWSAGDYALLAARLEPAAHTAAARVGDGHGRHALDVAAGTGSLAQALAERGWRTAAADISTRLVEEGRHTCAAAGLEVGWHVAPLDELPGEPGSLDLVASSFGMIFAPDPSAALAESRRVLRPGGALVLTTWPHDGYLAHMTAVMGTFLPPGAPVLAPFLWGDADVQRAWLDPWFTDVEVTTHRLPWQFDDVDTAVGFLFAASPGHLAAARAVGDRVEELRSAVADHLVEVNGSPGRVDLELDYLLTHAVARP